MNSRLVMAAGSCYMASTRTTQKTLTTVLLLVQSLLSDGSGIIAWYTTVP
jgi:hypothetical protein